jgi:hypothetical protein
MRLLLALAALVLSGLGSLAHAGSCEQRSPTVFVIKGAIDPALADCVDAKLRPTTTELVIDSHGGDVNAAIDIAERLSSLKALTLRVDGQCSSSCVNYILPMARRLLVGSQAILESHGSIDAAHVARAPPERKAAMKALADKQKAFARAHRIPPGWLFYHTAEAPTRVDGLDGAFRWRSEGPARFYLIEAPLLRSCLPWLDVDAYEAWLKGQMTPERVARLKKHGVVATGSVVCNGQRW